MVTTKWRGSVQFHQWNGGVNVCGVRAVSAACTVSWPWVPALIGSCGHQATGRGLCRLPKSLIRCLLCVFGMTYHLSHPFCEQHDDLMENMKVLKHALPSDIVKTKSMKVSVM